MIISHWKKEWLKSLNNIAVRELLDVQIPSPINNENNCLVFYIQTRKMSNLIQDDLTLIGPDNSAPSTPKPLIRQVLVTQIGQKLNQFYKKK